MTCTLVLTGAGVKVISSTHLFIIEESKVEQDKWPADGQRVQNETQGVVAQCSALLGGLPPTCSLSGILDDAPTEPPSQGAGIILVLRFLRHVGHLGSFLFTFCAWLTRPYEPGPHPLL